MDTPLIVRIIAGLVVTLGLAGALAAYFIFDTVRVKAPGPALPLPSAQNPGTFPHDAFDRVLKRFVDAQGRVDYPALTADRTDLERYMVALASTSPDKDPDAFVSNADRLAYWINAYNASVLYAVTALPELRSVADNKYKFFALTRYVYGGAPTSLYALENFIIRRRFSEPRIHFALNCASTGCPQLPAEAFVPQKLEAQLAREATAFCADPHKVRLKGGFIELSKIFEWYAEDFESDGGPVAFCQKWGRDDLPDDAEIRLIPYDWSLNIQPTDQGAAREGTRSRHPQKS
ncbi:MAG: DUF547 domain-containing protein [Myxococcota bacterium]